MYKTNNQFQRAVLPTPFPKMNHFLNMAHQFKITTPKPGRYNKNIELHLYVHITITALLLKLEQNCNNYIKTEPVNVHKETRTLAHYETQHQ